MLIAPTEHITDELDLLAEEKIKIGLRR